MTNRLIGKRLKALREERGLSQEELARVFGFNDRQTVSAIETGNRQVTAEELVLAVERLDTSLEYFTDPFLLAGEGRFSWRRTDIGPDQLEAYERKAGRWVAAFRTLAPQVGREAPLMRRKLNLVPESRYEDAMRAGERFVMECDLGDTPATRLADVMERQLGILVLMVDADRGISGAACRLPELDSVLIARREVAGRRHFDLAHELFHILTWDAMPPKRFEDALETGGSRVEQLANNFAAAVLMPAGVLERVRRLAGTCSGCVDCAVEWRGGRAACDCLSAAMAAGGAWIDQHGDGTCGSRCSTASQRTRRRAGCSPDSVSRPLMEVVGLAIGSGLVSVRRAAALLDTTVDELSGLFRAHGVACPADL